MKEVYVLWTSDGRDKWIEDIFADKDRAEAALRYMKQTDTQPGVYHYWIQTKEVK